MAIQATTHHPGPETIEALTADRQKMWASFTSATAATIVFMAVLLIAMAIFLL